MKGVFMKCDFDPKPSYVLKEYEKTTGKIYQSNQVWRNPVLQLRKDIKTPECGPKDLLIKVKSCAICGTDVHLLEHDEEGYVLYPWHAKMNIVLGHELSGIVAEVGSEVKDFKIGDYVCTEEMVWCGECIPCRNGFPNQCEHLEEIGLTLNGGMAEFCMSPAKICWKVDAIRERYGDGYDTFDFAAMVEPSSVAYNAIFERGQGFRPGAYGVIFGSGPVGLIGTALMKAGGASKVIVFEYQEKRRLLAKEMGADYVINPSELEKQGMTSGDAVMELTNGRGADIIMEASGVGNIVYPEITKSLGVNAHIIHTAMSGTPVPVLFPPMQGKAASIFASVGHSGNGTFENVIRLMGAGMLDIRPLISNVYRLDQALEAFEEAQKRSGAVTLFHD